MVGSLSASVQLAINNVTKQRKVLFNSISPQVRRVPTGSCWPGAPEEATGEHQQHHRHQHEDGDLRQDVDRDRLERHERREHDQEQRRQQHAMPGG